MKEINFIYNSKSTKDTKTLAKKFAADLKPGSWLGLTGDLGAGKTTFVQGLSEGLGIKDFVQSPTFVLTKEYQGDIRLVHIDLYRLSECDVSSLGLEDYCYGGEIVAVEWAEKLPESFKNDMIWLDFKVKDGNLRSIKITRRR